VDALLHPWLDATRPADDQHWTLDSGIELRSNQRRTDFRHRAAGATAAAHATVGGSDDVGVSPPARHRPSDHQQSRPHRLRGRSRGHGAGLAVGQLAHMPVPGGGCQTHEMHGIWIRHSRPAVVGGGATVKQLLVGSATKEGLVPSRR
jgi:hypothetical protein